MAESIEDSYSFSDDFYNFINQMQARSQGDSPVDNAEPTSEEDKDTTEPDSDYDDLQKRYDDLQAENDNLNSQIKDFRYADNDQIQNDVLLQQIYNSSGNSSVLDMVLNDDRADLEWAAKKSSKVNTQQTDPRLNSYLDKLPNNLKRKVTITSGNDQEHSPNSLHYDGKALDLRFQPDIQEYIQNDPIAQRMGISVLNPNHGNFRHTHVQVREYGGEDDGSGGGTDLWNTNKKQWVDSTLNANRNLNFVQRLYNGTKSIQVPGYPSRSTHLMSYDPNSKRVYPEVVNQNGNLVHLQGDDAWNYADRTGEFIQFQTAEQANWFSNSPDNTKGYKMGTDVLSGIKNGVPHKMKIGGKYKVD